MGIEPHYQGYLTTAASGPVVPHEWFRGTGSIVPRAGADLDFTTSDAHFLADDWSQQHPQLGGGVQTHAFLADPTRYEWFTKLDGVLDDLESQLGSKDWSRLGLTITFAGHGLEGDGSLFFDEDETVSARDLVDHLCSRAWKSNSTGLLVGLCLDSCYAGEFLMNFLEAIGEDDIIRPYYSFVATMPDELAWEDPGLQHGIASYCFSVQSELSTSVVADGIQPNNTYGPTLEIASGVVGAALLTRGQQHPILLDPLSGSLETATTNVRFLDSKDEIRKDIDEVRTELLAARDESRSLIEKLNDRRHGIPFRSSDEARRALTDPNLDNLVVAVDPEDEDNPEAKQSFLEVDRDTPSPW